MFFHRCGCLSVSISLARPAVAGGLQILLAVYRAAVAEAFRFIVGHVAPAVAGGFQDRVGLSMPPLRVAPTLDVLSRSGRFPIPVAAVADGIMIGAVRRCGGPQAPGF